MVQPSAVLDGPSLTPHASEPLHPRDWVMAQTALSAATRDALSVLVAAYGGLQVKNDEFFIIESRVSPHLRTTFRTFKNYLTKLRNLGLLEIIVRGPNQYGPKTIWRMRLDAFCRNGQMAMALDPDAEAASADGAKGKSDMQEQREDKDLAAGDGSVNNGIDRQEISSEQHLPEGFYQRRVVELEDLVGKQGNTITELMAEVRVLRSERDARGVTDTPTVDDTSEVSGNEPGWDAVLVQVVEETLKEIGAHGLTTPQRGRLRRAEKTWRGAHGGDAVPEEFITFAIKEAHRTKPNKFPGFIVTVIERRVKEGYRGRSTPDEERIQVYLQGRGELRDSQPSRY